MRLILDVLRLKSMLTLRRFTTTDGEKCLRLFRDTVCRINAMDYDPTQITAWASPDIEAAHWVDRFSGRHAYVADLDATIVGFADMALDGYLDRLFVSADHQRQGIATALVSQLLLDAVDTRIETISADVSITAVPFFTTMGFSDPTKQIVECRGSLLMNYRMTCKPTCRPTGKAHHR